MPKKQKISNGVKFSTIILLLLALFIAILFLVEPILVRPAAAGFVEIKNPLEADSITGIICSLTDILKYIAVGVGFVMVIWSGIMIMTASGSEEQLRKGKKTLMWTVIGVVIVVGMDFIIGLVIELLGGEVPDVCK